jgi:dsRNA-specific ribonuclease
MDFLLFSDKNSRSNNLETRINTNQYNQKQQHNHNHQPNHNHNHNHQHKGSNNSHTSPKHQNKSQNYNHYQSNKNNDKPKMTMNDKPKMNQSSSHLQQTVTIEDVGDDKKINPYNFNNRTIKKNEIENLLRRYGIYQTINDLTLYQQAFTHDSYCWAHANEIMERDSVKIVDKPEGAIELQTMSYQRLEFLGDRVINLIIAFYLFERYPGQNEGFMTKIYSKIVDSKGLARLARKVNFGQFILISRHLDEKNNARNKDKYLEDCFEAFIGALFYDFATKLNASGYVTAADFIIGPGFQICQKLIVNMIEDEETGIDFVELIGKDRNYKQKINTYFQTFGLKGKYHIEKNETIYIMNDGEIVFGSEMEDQPTNYSYYDRIWWISLKDNNDHVYATTMGREKQQTEQKCAFNALVKVGREKDEHDTDFDDPELDEWINAYNEKLKNGMIKNKSFTLDDILEL